MLVEPVGPTLAGSVALEDGMPLYEFDGKAPGVDPTAVVPPTSPSATAGSSVPCPADE
jgi:hypothetical protein